MNKLYEIWDKHIRNLIIFGFIALTLTLIINHNQEEIYYQEVKRKLQIGDSAVIDLGFGETLTIIKVKDHETNSIDTVAPIGSNHN